MSKRDRVRARDGDGCWLCGGKLDFNAQPNSKKAPTIEHLHAVSDGGGGEIDNLVLCHPGCNRQLGNRPKADKLKIREKRQKALAAQVAAAKVAKASGVVKAIPMARPVAAKKPVIPERRDELGRLRMIAIVATIIAAFACGLSLGLLIAG